MTRGQIIPRKSGFTIRIFTGRDAKGKRQYLNQRVTGTKKDAQKVLTSMLKKLDTGDLLLEPSQMTLSEYLDYWLETAARNRVSEKTFHMYCDMMRRYVGTNIGHVKLVRLEPMQIQKLYAEMQTSGLTARTVRYTHMVLNNALKQAVKWRMSAQNPAQYVDLPKHTPKEARAMTKEQVEAFLNEAQTLPQDEYSRLVRTDTSIPRTLLKNFSTIPKGATGDLFGQIYEYFLGNFALAEGQGGGEFFTPRSVVRLMVEIIEPTGGSVFDPACGSGGMFVQSAQFRNEHKPKNDQGFFVYGQEKSSETVKLAKMNLAVNGLRGEVKQAISYYEDPFSSMGKFDYVLANPPFNVDDVSYSQIKNDERFKTYGIPRKKSGKKDDSKETVPNANYLWINLFVTSLNDKGRAGLVMANSASDARHSEADIRQTLIEKNLIYAMVTLPSNMFYTVTLPATLWFFDKDKQDDKVLFIDARNIFTQIDRAHREFSAEQISNIAIISQLHKGNRQGFIDLIDSYFAKGMKSLKDNQTKIKPLTEQLELVLDDETGKTAAHNLQTVWDDLTGLESSYTSFKNATYQAVESQNEAKHNLRQTFNPFFETLHKNLKQLDKTLREHEKEQKKTDQQTRQLKAALEELHKDVKEAESFYKHINWLQGRFPEAKYEDVTGLCKRADLLDIKEQDYSLNPGRYVGVVIEEDGKTEEEFLDEVLQLNNELESLANTAKSLSNTITLNIRELVGA